MNNDASYTIKEITKDIVKVVFEYPSLPASEEVTIRTSDINMESKENLINGVVGHLNSWVQNVIAKDNLERQEEVEKDNLEDIKKDIKINEKVTIEVKVEDHEKVVMDKYDAEQAKLEAAETAKTEVASEN